MIYNNIRELVKSNPPKLPVVIPSYNNPSYVKNMINQLNKYGFQNGDIIILDNFSRSTDMFFLLRDLGKDGYRVVRKFTNDGPREYYTNSILFNWLPEKFILTDPDIGFNENLPENFVDLLIEVSEKHNLYKVGFALDIEMEHLAGDTNIKTIMFNPTLSMYQWELQFYTNKIGSIDGNTIWSAAIDTTFCLVNKKFFEPYLEPMQIKNKCARIAGNFTAQHYGWYNKPPMSEEEYAYYLSQVPPQWSFTSNEIKRRKGL